jgi:hypothetical protein
MRQWAIYHLIWSRKKKKFAWLFDRVTATTCRQTTRRKSWLMELKRKASPDTCQQTPSTVMDDRKVCKKHQFQSLAPKTLQQTPIWTDSVSSYKHRLLVHRRNALQLCLLVLTIQIRTESGIVQQDKLNIMTCMSFSFLFDFSSLVKYEAYRLQWKMKWS